MYWSAVKLKMTLFVTAVLAAVVYGLLWAAVVFNWAWVDIADTWTLRRFHDIGMNRPGWVAFWRAVSDLLTVLRVVAAVAFVAALIRRQVRTAAFLFVAFVGTGLMTATAKAISDRPRPETALTAASSSAFPSGHSLGMTVGVLAFLTVLWPWMIPAVRRIAAIAGVALILLVSLARVVLNVHHPSDIVAGWALGFLYYLLCLRVVPPWLTATPPAQESDLISPS